MSYWVYENWTSGRVVKLHSGACGFCKEGHGRSGRGTQPINGRWLGPFATLVEARACAHALRPAAIDEHRCCQQPDKARTHLPHSPSKTRKKPGSRLPATDGQDAHPSEFLLLGCSAEKLRQPAPAKNLYSSKRFRRRRRYAEASGKPWAIVSAKHGLLSPDQVIEPYELSLAELNQQERADWAAFVVRQLAESLGSLHGRTFELHASKLYGDPLEAQLSRLGAQLVRPLRHVNLYQEAAWYAHHSSEGWPEGTATRRVLLAAKSPPLGLARELTQAFMDGTIDLSARPENAPVGWQGVPEVPAADELRTAGVSEEALRTFLTFTCAMDRARDAEHLWQVATRLYLAAPRLFEPRYVLSHEDEVATSLRSAGVSQHHGPDLAAWMRLAATLAGLDPGSTIGTALREGAGDAGEILRERLTCSADGTPLYPMLRGPKIGPMWVRILAYPGGARFTSIADLPVAVDVQVRRASEHLGIVASERMTIEQARPLIQAAWQADVSAQGAVGPAGLEDTCAALDPPLWFFGKHGCSYCVSVNARVPAAEVCRHCRAAFS